MGTTTITTHRGKQITLISERDLCDPLYSNERIRAFCHLHGSDTQRSLSINKETGWGHCFNAACNATVLVEEFNTEVFDYLRNAYGLQSSHLAQSSFSTTHAYHQSTRSVAPSTVSQWQRNEAMALHSLNTDMHEALATSWKAQAYLEERGLPLHLAQEAGLCYLPSHLIEGSKHCELLRRWVGRLLFPLHSPCGQGYIGRSLWGWEKGMDENTHKSILNQPHAPRRWIKTNPAGWFGYTPLSLAPCIVLVEGGFDRLTLLLAGFHPPTVVALAGTAVKAEWLLHCPQIKAVILALDADVGGTTAIQRLATTLRHAGLSVELCSPPQDRWGKDWSERYRRIGPQTVWSLYDAYTQLSHIVSRHS